MPTSAATAFAARSLSPVSRTTSRPSVAKGGDGRGGRRLDRVADDDDGLGAHRRADGYRLADRGGGGPAGEDGGEAAGLGVGGGLLELGRDDVEHATRADPDLARLTVGAVLALAGRLRRSLDRRGHALSGRHAEVGDAAMRLDERGDRAPDRVLGVLLGRGGGLDEVAPRLVVEARGDDVRRLHPPLGDRARLVEHDDVDAAGRLEDGSAPDEGAELGAASRADHDGERGGEAEGARARDDQDGDGGGERAVDVAGRRPPHGERDERDADHRRDEDARDAVREALDVRLARLGLVDHRRDLREHRLRSHAGRLDRDGAVRRDRAADDVVADARADGDGLARGERRVDGGGPFDHHAVGRDRLARSGHEAHAHGEVLERDLAPVLEPRGVGLDLRQRLGWRRRRARWSGPRSTFRAGSATR